MELILLFIAAVVVAILGFALLSSMLPIAVPLAFVVLICAIPLLPVLLLITFLGKNRNKKSEEGKDELAQINLLHKQAESFKHRIENLETILMDERK